jgi:malate dehydrogenase
MKVSIIGAGNVGGLAAMRLLESGITELVLVDIAGGLAEGKALDLEDTKALLKYNYNIQGTDDIKDVRDSDIIVVTAGMARKPGMTREELLSKNAAILKDICSGIKTQSPDAIVIIVTNPLDLMTYFALKITGFSPKKIFGMGVSLDASRFANLIAQELNIPITDIEATVIGAHGEGMLPLIRFTTIKGLPLDKFIDAKARENLMHKTIDRGREIVSLLGSGSAYFAPSAAIASLVRAIAKDEKRVLGISAYLNGEYGIKDICIGVPCRLGKGGIEKIIELDLEKGEKEALLNCAESIRKLNEQLFD